jgi:hypothetical protein
MPRDPLHQPEAEKIARDRERHQRDRITYALMFAISAALLVQGAVGLVR